MMNLLLTQEGHLTPFVFIVLFVLATLLGYIIIKKVPSLLHTPLMSGMNALSGITILGAMTAVSVLYKEEYPLVSASLGALAIILAMINVVGGFGVTKRMLSMFRKRGDSK